MIRTALWVVGGAILGGIIHLAVILMLPGLATNSVWMRISALGERNELIVVTPPAPGEANPLGLDPELAYAICRINLASGPGEVSGTLPQGSWSVAVYDRSGAVIYSTTNRDGIGQHLDLGIFNTVQTRLLARQQLDVAEGLLIVESPVDDVFAVVRLALPHAVMRTRFEAALSQMICGNIS